MPYASFIWSFHCPLFYLSISWLCLIFSFGSRRCRIVCRLNLEHAMIKFQISIAYSCLLKLDRWVGLSVLALSLGHMSKSIINILYAI
jgi:hypothetical protein